ARTEGVVFQGWSGQGDAPELEALAELDRGAGTARDLDAAAADVDHHGDVAGQADAVGSRQMNEPGFLRSGNHSRANASLFGNGLKKFSAVLGFTRCAGRNRNHFINV